MKDISCDDIKKNLPLITRKDPPRRIGVGDYVITKEKITVIAGPCTIEGKSQIMDIAKHVKEAGAVMLRGGVFKPLTFPYGDPLGRRDSDFGEGMEKGILPKKRLYENAERRLGYLKEAGEKYGLPVVSEILYADSMEMMEEYVDMFQVGYRHMFNMDLIVALSRSKKPILLKRHYGESLRSLLGVGEHFEARGKREIVFCERGIVVPHTHNPESRAILDIQAIPALNEYAPTIPVVVDPSHACFRRSYVAPLARAAIACGADGLLVEVHPNPENAWVDPLQSLNYQDFERLMKEVMGIAKILGKA